MLCCAVAQCTWRDSAAGVAPAEQPGRNTRARHCTARPGSERGAPSYATPLLPSSSQVRTFFTRVARLSTAYFDFVETAPRGRDCFMAVANGAHSDVDSRERPAVFWGGLLQGASVSSPMLHGMDGWWSPVHAYMHAFVILRYAAPAGGAGER